MSCGRLDWLDLYAFWECFEMGHRVCRASLGEKCWVCFVFFSCLDFYFLSFDFLIWDCPMSLLCLPAQTLLILYLV